MFIIGTDVYLSWDGQTKAEEKAQITGYSINAGSVGYLRASISMEKENAVLREVFPDKFWEGKALPYDFDAGWKTLNLIAKKYLSSCLFGIPIERFKQVFQQLAEAGKFDKIIVGDIDDDILGNVTWLNSLVEFFRLGYKKQKEYKNPKVCISW